MEIISALLHFLFALEFILRSWKWGPGASCLTAEGCIWRNARKHFPVPGLWPVATWTTKNYHQLCYSGWRDLWMFSENLWTQTQTEQSPEETQWPLLKGKNEFNVYRVRVRGGKEKKERGFTLSNIQFEPWALNFQRWWQESHFYNIFLPLHPPCMRNCSKHKTLLMNINQ